MTYNNFNLFTSSSANSVKLFWKWSTLRPLCSFSSSFAFSDMASKVEHASCCLEMEKISLELRQIQEERGKRQEAIDGGYNIMQGILYNV